MAIFLSKTSGGADASVAAGRAHQMHNAPTCPPLYYPRECSVPIPSDLLNAIISEIACAVDSLGLTYDCGAVCNLGAAVMTRASVSGWCGASRAEAEAAKGSALSDGDHWLDATAGTAYYVDAAGQDVAFSPQPAVFLCCSSGRVYARCGGVMKHLPGTGEVIIPRAEGQCGDTAPLNPADGTMWLDTSVSPRVVRVFGGGGWQPSDPQPEFFTCCSGPSPHPDGNPVLWTRCAGSYFWLGEVPSGGGGGGGGGGWVTVLEASYSTGGFFNGNQIGRAIIDKTGLDFSAVLAAATKVRVTVGAGGSRCELAHLCMGEAADSVGYDHTVAGTIDVTFGGSNAVNIPSGDIALSDEMAYSVDPSTFKGFWFGFKTSSGYGGRPNRNDSTPGARGGYKTSANTCGNEANLTTNTRLYLIRKIEVFVP